jgi:hypothetical protein
MLHLFVPPTSFEGCGQSPYERTSISQLLASLIMFVSLGGLTLTLCRCLSYALRRTPSAPWAGRRGPGTLSRRRDVRLRSSLQSGAGRILHALVGEAGLGRA